MSWSIPGLSDIHRESNFHKEHWHNYGQQVELSNDTVSTDSVLFQPHTSHIQNNRLVTFMSLHNQTMVARGRRKSPSQYYLTPSKETLYRLTKRYSVCDLPSRIHAWRLYDNTSMWWETCVPYQVYWVMACQEQ